MIKRILFFVGCCLGLGVLIGTTVFILQNNYLQNSQEVRELSSQNQVVHYSYFTDKQDYDRAFALVNDTRPIDERIYGGIAPHHLLAAELLAEFYWRLRDQNVDTVVVIGPNHFENGFDTFATSKATWQTPFGELPANTLAIDKLLATGLVSLEEQPFEREHSISAHVAFIEKIWPKSEIVPLIVKYQTNDDEVAELAATIEEMSDEHTLVVASVDFSHHLPPWMSEMHDQFSIATINSFDTDRLGKLEIDSPGSISLLLQYLEKKGALKSIQLANESAASLLGTQELMDNTSYFTQYFGLGNADSNSTFSLLFFGDTMFDRQIKQFISRVNDWEYPFLQLAGDEGQFFKGVDGLVANLEGPITDQPVKNTTKDISFVFDPILTNTFRRFNFNILGLANNHTYDQGSKGLKRTRELLSQAGIATFGDPLEESFSHVLIKKFGDQRVAFIGINASDHAVDNDDIGSLIKRTDGLSDFIIVFVHWGGEYQQNPSPRQKKLAEIFIDNGADVVIGHHPHIIQPIGKYQEKLIFYSLGNFIFDQDFSAETQEGMAIGLVANNQSSTFYLIPYYILEGQAVLMDHQARSSLLKRLSDNSPLDKKTKKQIELGMIKINNSF